MQLLSRRIWPAVSVFFVAMLGAFHVTTLVPSGGGGLTLLIGLTLAVGAAVAAFQLWPQSVIAAIEDGRLVVGRKSAALADLMGVRVETVVVNFVPTNRTYVFHFNGTPKRLAVNVSRVAGGRRTVAAFADQAMGLAEPRRAAAALARAPRPEAALDFAAAPTLGDDGFDPDAIIARYLEAKNAAPAPAPARPSFGRRAA